MTQVDSFRPALLGVSIDLSGFTNAAPADGAIDPTTIQKYMLLEVQTGTTVPVATNGDTIAINGVSITFTTAGGLNIAGIIATINALTDDHHCIASNSGGKLALTNEATYEDFGITMTGSVTVLTELGFVAPVRTYPNSTGVDTLAHSLAKSRGNSRWAQMVKLMGFEANVVNIGGVRKTGGGMNSQPTAIAFTVTYADFSQIYTYDELNNNALMKGIPALQRMIARLLIADRFEVRDVLNPEIQVNSSPVTEDQALTVEIGALSANMAAANGVITITPITLVR